VNTRDYRIFPLFASLVREQFPDARIWAFGSRVNDTAAQGSDLDVCVVLKTLNDATDQPVLDIAWRVGFEHDLLISTVTYVRDEFENGPCSQSSFISTILQSGVAA